MKNKRLTMYKAIIIFRLYKLSLEKFIYRNLKKKFEKKI